MSYLFKLLYLRILKRFSRVILLYLCLGGIIVGVSAKGARLQHWLDMMKHPGQTVTQTHFLSASFVD